MSFTLIVHAKDGKASIDSVAGELPDGEWEITGNAYPGPHRYPSINIMWRDDRGRYLIHAAQTTHSEDDRIWPELTAAAR